MVKPYCDGIRVREVDGTPVKRMGPNIRPDATLSDLQWLKSKGYKSVRLVVYWSDIESTEGTYKWALYDTFLANCQAVGIWVIIDCHQWDWSSPFTGGKGKGIGFPPWMYNNTKYGNYNNDRAAAMREFYRKDTPNGVLFRAKFKALWVAMVARYKTNPFVWAYEIINEPMVGASNILPNESDCHSVWDFYMEIIPAIRAVDPETIIFCHSYNMPHADQHAIEKAIPYPNIVWTRSCYPEYGDGSQSFFNLRAQDWNQGYLMAVPYAISETGASNAWYTSKGAAYIDSALTSMFARYKATMNGGDCVIWHTWIFGHGIASGFWSPMSATLGESWLHTILAKQLTATPPPVNYSLTVLTPTGSGATTPGIGVHTYPSGTPVQVTALPSSNWAFDHWTLDGTLPTENPVTITVTKDLNIRAVFVQASPPDPCQTYKDQITALLSSETTLKNQVATLSSQVTGLGNQVSQLQIKIVKAIPDIQKALQELQ